MGIESLKVEAQKGEVFHEDIQERIIYDIREMDMDSLVDLIRYMYHVNVEENDDCETLTISLLDPRDGETLNDIFG